MEGCRGTKLFHSVYHDEQCGFECSLNAWLYERDNQRTPAGAPVSDEFDPLHGFPTPGEPEVRFENRIPLYHSGFSAGPKERDRCEGGLACLGHKTWGEKIFAARSFHPYSLERYVLGFTKRCLVPIMLVCKEWRDRIQMDPFWFPLWRMVETFAKEIYWIRWVRSRVYKKIKKDAAVTPSFLYRRCMGYLLYRKRDKLLKRLSHEKRRRIAYLGPPARSLKRAKPN